VIRVEIQKQLPIIHFVLPNTTSNVILQVIWADQSARILIDLQKGN